MTSQPQQRCAACGLPLDPGAVFCAECGARAALDPPRAAETRDDGPARSAPGGARPPQPPTWAPPPEPGPQSRRVEPAQSGPFPVAPDAVAPVGRRVLAFLLDSVLLAVVVWGASLVVALTMPAPSTDAPVSPVAAIPSVLALVVLIGQWVAEATTGATVGSAVMGIRTVSARTGRPAGLLAILLRGLVVGAGALVCFVGQWAVVASGAWDRGPSLRGWHDKAAGTLVLRAHALVAGTPPRAPRQSRSVPAEAGGVPVVAAGEQGAVPAVPASFAPARDVPVLTFPSQPSPRRHTDVAGDPPVSVGGPAPQVPAVDPRTAGPDVSSAADPQAPAAAVPSAAPSAPIARVPFESMPGPGRALVEPVAPAPDGPATTRRARRAATGPTPLVDVPWATALPPATGAVPVVADAPPPASSAADGAPAVPAVAPAPAVPPVPSPVTAPTVAIAGPPPGGEDPAPRGQVHAPAFDAFAELELTRLRQLDEVTELRLVLDTGERVDVVGDGLIGRRPDPQPGIVHVVCVDDPARSVSKVHLAFGLDGSGPGMLWVTDRGSTNGSVVVSPSGAESALPPGARAVVGVGWTVRFGERRLTVERA